MLANGDAIEVRQDSASVSLCRQGDPDVVETIVTSFIGQLKCAFDYVGLRHVIQALTEDGRSVRNRTLASISGLLSRLRETKGAGLIEIAGKSRLDQIPAQTREPNLAWRLVAVMMRSIAFVGAGPTTLYTLAAFLAEGRKDVAVTLFEQQAVAGRGSPFRPGWNDPAMLANIASIEIPPIEETFVEWLSRQPDEALRAINVRPDEINERAFLPRIALGAFFADQLERLVERARASGHVIDVKTRRRVIDVRQSDNGFRLTIAPLLGFVTDEYFDHVVLATGHQWSNEAEASPGYFTTPWPASKLSKVASTKIGIRGTSLTGIDAAITLAAAHGDFIDQGQDAFTYQPHPNTEAFSLTLMSRKGVLPEADFYFPLPHPALAICTQDAVAELIAQADCSLLDQVFDLFRRELTLCDPEYAQENALAGMTLERFSEQYFAARSAIDPFEWAQSNLDEARANHTARRTVPWRDAILRMHEVVGAVAPHLDDLAFGRFERHLKPVFVDNYGAVPHASIGRLLALRQADKIKVLALGDDYRLETDRAQGGAMLSLGEERIHFPVFVEALGQSPLQAEAFPFPSLLAQGLITDASSIASTDGDPPANLASRGVAVDEVFHPLVEGAPNPRLHCLSLPFIMGRHPFVQGVTSSHAIGQQVGVALASAIEAAPEPSLVDLHDLMAATQAA